MRWTFLSIKWGITFKIMAHHSFILVQLITSSSFILISAKNLSLKIRIKSEKNTGSKWKNSWKKGRKSQKPMCRHVSKSTEICNISGKALQNAKLALAPRAPRKNTIDKQQKQSLQLCVNRHFFLPLTVGRPVFLPSEDHFQFTHCKLPGMNSTSRAKTVKQYESYLT